MARTIPFNFRTLETFIAVIDCGGMTAAAKKLGWSQSAVSQTVASLEQEIGCKLVERRGRQIALTASGDLFYSQAGDLIAQANELTNKVKNNEGRKAASLRIGMVESFAATAGAGLVRRLENSAHQIKVRSGIAPYLLQSFEQGELDVIITMGPVSLPENAIVVRLLMESYLLAIPNSYASLSLPARLDQLCADLPLIRFSGHTPSGLWTENYMKRFGLKSTSSYEFDSANSVLSMVKEGVGWSLVTPLCLAQAPEHSADIRFSRLPPPGYFRELLIVAKSEISSNLLEQFIKSAQLQLSQSTLPSIQQYVPWLSEREFQIS